MAHIHTKPGQHDHTASAFIFRFDGGEPKLMLHMHKILKKYLQFGGHIELDETPWQAVTHEILEESGYEMSQLKILQPKIRLKNFSLGVLHPYAAYNFTHEFEKGHFHTDFGYIFVTKEPPKQKISDDESDDIQLFTRGELIARGGIDVAENIRDIGLFAFDVVLKEWEQVPATDFD